MCIWVQRGCRLIKKMYRHVMSNLDANQTEPLSSWFLSDLLPIVLYSFQLSKSQAALWPLAVPKSHGVSGGFYFDLAKELLPLFTDFPWTCRKTWYADHSTQWVRHFVMDFVVLKLADQNRLKNKFILHFNAFWKSEKPIAIVLSFVLLQFFLHRRVMRFEPENRLKSNGTSLFGLKNKQFHLSLGIFRKRFIDLYDSFFFWIHFGWIYSFSCGIEIEGAGATDDVLKCIACRMHLPS